MNLQPHVTGLPLPRWVQTLFEGTPRRSSAVCSEVQIREAASFLLLTYTLRDAVRLDAESLRSAVSLAYVRLLESLRPEACPHPVRFWNFIPQLLEPLGEYRQRYMAFNAGRFAGFSDSRRRGSYPTQTLPTASGVGHQGEDLVIHCLGSRVPGQPIENPRQIPAYRYSLRYGPQPPCFSRATRLTFPGEPSPWLLIGGTASVVGEDSAHALDPKEQLEETVRNLEALVTSALAAGGAADDGEAPFPSLSLLRDLRIYHLSSIAPDELHDLVTSSFPDLASLEYVAAQICRPELRLELEGLARLPARRLVGSAA